MPKYHVIANRSAVESVRLVIEAPNARLAEISANGWLNSCDFNEDRPPNIVSEADFKCYGDTESVWDDFEVIEKVTSEKQLPPWSPWSTRSGGRI